MRLLLGFSIAVLALFGGERTLLSQAAVTAAADVAADVAHAELPDTTLPPLIERIEIERELEDWQRDARFALLAVVVADLVERGEEVPVEAEKRRGRTPLCFLQRTSRGPPRA